MNKSRIIPGLLLVVLGVAGTYWFFNSNEDGITKDSKTEPTVNELPHMLIRFQDGEQLNVRSFWSDNTVLILYQPECDHCQREAKEIRENLDAFDGYNLYFITTDPFDKIEDFANEYKLSGIDRIYFGQTDAQAIWDNFGQISAPSVYIYREAKQIKAFNGETAIDTILQVL